MPRVGRVRHSAGHAAGDIHALNRWLSLTRLRATAGLALLAVALHLWGIAGIHTAPALVVCSVLASFSLPALAWHASRRAPVALLYVQLTVDVVMATLGIGLAASGLARFWLRPIYFLVIIPAGFVSVPCGVVFASAAAAGHEALLILERGWSLATLASLQSVVPVFLFYAVLQQAFFYARHLAAKNRALEEAAERLHEQQRRLATDARISGALVEVAETLSSTLEPRALLERVNRVACATLRADSCTTILVDLEKGRFRIAASTEPLPDDQLRTLDFPVSALRWLDGMRDRDFLILDAGECQQMPPMIAGGQHQPTTFFVAPLRYEGALSGLLVIGYGPTAPPEAAEAEELLCGIARHATIALRNADLLAEVQRASATKSDFVGTVSHELRSPLHAILGYLEMALDTDLDAVGEVRGDILRRVQVYSLQLLELINTLLDVNRLEAGRLAVTRSRFAATSLLAELWQSIPEGWIPSAVQLHGDVAPELPELCTDRGKLKTILRNLVHNALKYTQRGRVVVRVRQEHEKAVLEVEDTGAGIPEAALEHIFEMFRQADPSDARRGGVGLGLYIVRRFTEALDGTITVTSKVGEGSRFTIKLPAFASVGECLDPDAPRPITGTAPPDR